MGTIDDMSSGCAVNFLRFNALKNCCSEGYTQWPDFEAPVSCSLLAAEGTAMGSEADRGIEDITLAVGKGIDVVDF